LLQDTTSEQNSIAAVVAAWKYRPDRATQCDVIFRATPNALANAGRQTPQTDMTITEEAERLFKPQAEAHAVSEYEREQQKIRANMARQKAERLAREAALDNGRQP
jgi:hypothetical protein